MYPAHAVCRRRAAHATRAGARPDTIDFGPVATDGAVKINREPGQLVLFPYPRDKRFRVSLEMKTLAPAADPAKVKVRMLAAGDCHDLGPAEFHAENGRLAISLGQPGAGRFVVQW